MTMHGAVKSFVENVYRSQSTRAAASFTFHDPPALRSETHDRPVKLGGNGQGTLQRLIRPLPDAVESIHHRSSRKPLKNGCRTFPSADFALYSISANSFGSTQMPLWAIRFA